jgi:multiple antibiotic resistance protein
VAHKLLHDFVTLFVVVNPVGVVPLFIAVAGQEGRARQRRIALHAVLVSVVILLAFIAIGQVAIEALGIELASFQIAGGLVLLIIALRMVLEEVRAMPRDTGAWGNVAVFPLAMPFIAGPASIMAVVLLTDDNVYTGWQQVETACVTLVVLVITYFCLIGAELVQRLLGSTGTSVVSRIMGLILAALAVQSMLGALRQIRLT